MSAFGRQSERPERPKWGALLTFKTQTTMVTDGHFERLAKFARRQFSSPDGLPRIASIKLVAKAHQEFDGP